MAEAGKQVWSVNDHLQPAPLRVDLDAHVLAEAVGAVRHDEDVIVG